MKLKINTIIVVFFVALFSDGFSSLTAQTTLYSDSGSSATEMTSAENFENHVQKYIPVGLVNYITTNYEEFSSNQIKFLLRFANEKSQAVDVVRRKELREQLESWMNNNIPSEDLQSLLANLHGHNYNFTKNNQ